MTNVERPGVRESEFVRYHGRPCSLIGLESMASHTASEFGLSDPVSSNLIGLEIRTRPLTQPLKKNCKFLTFDTNSTSDMNQMC